MADELTVRAKRLLYFVTEDWYFVSHRLALAVAARSAGYDVYVVTRVREHGEMIKAAGLSLVPFEITRGGLNPLKELATLIRLFSVFRQVRPDIVHGVGIKPVLYGSIASRMARVRHVINALAGMGWLFSSGSRLAVVLKSFVRLALRFLLRDGITLVQNPDDERLLLRMGILSSHVRRIAGAGVDVNEYRPRVDHSGQIVVVLPARLLWQKGVGEFVEAARELRRRGVTARFILAGQPDIANPSAVPAATIQEWVSEGVVECAGWVKDMPGLLSETSIVCLPSYYGEGIPKALIEAAAAGLPIVTSDMPGCREIVQDGVNGILVPPHDFKAVANALDRLIANPELRRDMGARGRQRVENEFELGIVISQTLALYSQGDLRAHAQTS